MTRFKRGDVVEIIAEGNRYGGVALVRADMNGIIIEQADQSCWWWELGTMVAVLGDRDRLLYRRPARKGKR